MEKEPISMEDTKLNFQTLGRGFAYLISAYILAQKLDGNFNNLTYTSILFWWVASSVLLSTIFGLIGESLVNIVNERDN